jgi:uncharacterized membrane protein YfcA
MSGTDLSIAAIFGSAVLAGLFGSLTGLGGGALIVPLLSIGFGLDIRLAVGASLVSIIATSSGAAVSYVRDHLTNIRIGMLLEMGTTVGALTGALVAGLLRANVIFGLFGVVLILSVLPTAKKLGEDLPRGVRNDRLAARLRLGSRYPDRGLQRDVAYQVTGVPAGLSMMYFAGVFSGLLGIGAGALKVLAMDTAMRLPMKVSSATSNFMIGVTAAASASVYFWRGDVVPVVAAAVALGALFGATMGARLLRRFDNTTVRLIFIPVLMAAGIEMLLRAFGVA